MTREPTRAAVLPLAVAATLGALALAATVTQSPAEPALHWAADAAAGVGAVALLALRRRHPVAVAVLVVLASAVASSVFGATLVAIVSLATRRRWRSVIGVGLLLVAVTVGDDLLAGRTDLVWGRSALVVAVYSALAAAGAYLGSRRDLLAALRERAASAERERQAAEQAQAARVEQAQVAERTRIAREMHDVLAHRISLVALHAGALAFRSDVPEAERAATAAVVRDNANLALAELRQVLGVLRAGSGDGTPEAPQPTLRALDELVAEASAAGGVPVDVTIPDATRSALGLLPAPLGRDAYRIVQEGLTNARKHAPGAPARVAVGGGPGGLLTVEVRSGAPTRPPAGVEGSGTGLVGVAERVRLAGGRLDHGPDDDGGYRLRAVLPWDEEEQDG
ncbi:sensor histidine kinase [Cellulomonas sp. Marseille-Q8402]